MCAVKSQLRFFAVSEARLWNAADRVADRGVARAVRLFPLAAVAVRAAGGLIPAVAFAELLARHALRRHHRRADEREQEEHKGDHHQGSEAGRGG